MNIAVLRMDEGVICPARQSSGELHNEITISKQHVGPNTRLILNTFRAHIVSRLLVVLQHDDFKNRT